VGGFARVEFCVELGYVGDASVGQMDAGYSNQQGVFRPCSWRFLFFV